MSSSITASDTLSLATITDNQTLLTIAHLSIDTHTTNTPHVAALEAMVPELLLSGCGAMSRAEFLHALNSLGARLTITIERGIFHLTITATAAVFPKVVKLLKILLTEPRFEAPEIARVKTLIQNQLIHHDEDSQARAHEALINHFYSPSDRRYTYSRTERMNAVSAIKKRDLERYMGELRSRYCYAAIASTTPAITLFTKTVSQIFTQGISPTRVHETAPSTTNRLVITPVPSRQNIDFSIGAPVSITASHPEYPALLLALAILGKWGGFTGRLMSTVREKEGLTYGIYAQAEGFFQQETGMWRIMSFFSPQNAVTGLTSTFREVAKLYKHGTTTAELDSFKMILGTGEQLIQDSLSSRLRELHGYQRRGFTLDEIATEKTRLRSVTLDEVHRAIAAHLNPAHLVISAAGPTAPVEKELRTFAKGVS